MRVLIACEFSGVVREAFKSMGCDAWSCDLLDTEIRGSHFKCDIKNVLDLGWDLMIAHPPCTYLCVSGNRWFNEQRDFSEFGIEFEDRRVKQRAAIEFVMELINSPVPRIAIENPIGVLSTAIRKPDQIIQPWYFGHGETKSTCLWLKNLPLLEPTNIVDGRENIIHRMAPSRNRSR